MTGGMGRGASRDFGIYLRLEENRSAATYGTATDLCMSSSGFISTKFSESKILNKMQKRFKFALKPLLLIHCVVQNLKATEAGT